MANKKITELTALTDPDANDLLAIVDDPSGSPETKRITATKLVKSINNQSPTFIVAASNSLHKERADYVCDGVDDQVVIQAALDALPSTGGKVVLMDGTFLIEEHSDHSHCGVALLKDNIVLSGIGWSTYLVRGTTLDGPVIGIGGYKEAAINDCIVENMKINQTGGGATGVKNKCILTYCKDGDQSTGPYPQRNIVRGIEAYNAGAEGISFDYIEYCELSNCYIHDNYQGSGGMCELAMYMGKGCLVKNNLVSGSLTCGLNLWGLRESIILGNEIHVAGVGIYFQNSNVGFPVSNNIISNNRIVGGLSGISLYINQVDGGFGNLITNNHVSNTENIGISLESTTGSIKCTHNLITNNQVINAGTHGIYAKNVNYNVIKNNSVINPSQNTHATSHGIVLSQESKHNIVSSNWVISDVVKRMKYGIAEVAVVQEYNEIVNNRIDGAATAGMLINGVHTFYFRSVSDLLMDVLAVSATHVRSNEDLSAGTPITFTIDAQPDIPRTLSGHFDSHGQITAYTIVITGTDAKGNVVAETFTEATSPWDFETVNAYATVTSIIMTTRTGTGAGDTIDIGITDVLGLSNIIYETGDVFKIKKDNANVAVAAAQVNTTYDTYDMSVIGLAATNDFTIWYKSNLNKIS